MFHYCSPVCLMVAWRGEQGVRQRPSAAFEAEPFGSGDKSGLISAGKGEAKDGPGEKLSNTKSRK